MRQRYLLTALLALMFTGLAAQPYTFQSRGIGGGGALFFPSVNPANDNEFYVSCDMSELFHSTDFGLTYSQVDFQKLQVFGTSTYEFTSNPSIAYSNFNDGNEGYPVKTTDGGATWSALPGYSTATYGPAYTVRANYDDPSRVIIGAYGDILFSNNGGQTFSLVRHAAWMGAGITLGGVFWDGANIYIGTNEGIIRSADGGNTFSLMNTTGMAAGQVIWSFAGAKQSGTTRFVCIAAGNSDTYNGIMPWDYYNYAKGVYTMDQAGGTWVSKSQGISFSNDFVMYAAMARNDIQTIYLGGHDNALSAPLVLRSADGGASWSKVFNTTNNANITTGWEGYNGDKNWSWSETCFGITAAPLNSAKVLFGSFSSVQASSDGGNTWRQAYADPADQHPAGSSTPKNQSYHSIGLENTTCWQVFWKDANTMMGCFSDIGGIRSLDGGASWGYQYTGFSVNSLYRIVAGADGTLFGACSNIHDLYESTRLADAQLDANDGNGKIVYSTDGGATWSDLHLFGHPVYWLAADPGNPKRMYASVVHFGGVQGSQQGGIYRTDNLDQLAGSSWVKLPNPPRTEGHPACITVLNDGKMVCTFSGRRNPSGSFTASSGTFLYDPAQNSWTDVSDPGMYYWTRDIVSDPRDAGQNTWYVAVYSGWGGAPNGLGGLYRTTNRGAGWTKLTGSQFDRVASLAFNPQNGDQAYLTTETQGLWVSAGINDAVPSWSLVQEYPFRQPERVFFNPFQPDEFWVTSFGNGMKKGGTGSSGIWDRGTRDARSLVVQPNPNPGTFILSVDIPQKCSGRLVMDNVQGGTVFTSRLLLNSGPNAIPVSVNLRAGIYLVSVITPGERFSARMVLVPQQ